MQSNRTSKAPLLPILPPVLASSAVRLPCDPARPASTASVPVPEVRIIRSERRKRTISGHLVGDVLEIRVPAGMSPSDEASAVHRITERVLRRHRMRMFDDGDLVRRARMLCREYLGVPDPPLRFARYVEMETRWGSSTPRDGTIRIAARLRSLPAWVEDYVIVHELVHLLVPRNGHDARFWKLVGLYPRAERARGYLEAVIAMDAATHRNDTGHRPDADFFRATGRTDPLLDDAGGEMDDEVDGEGPGGSDRVSGTRGAP